MVSFFAVLPPVSGDPLTLHYIILWTFVLGGALIWTVFHLQRNARLRESRRKAAELRAQLTTILQHSREVLYSLDLSAWQFRYMSHACYSLTGFTADEIGAMDTADLLARVHPDDREKISRLIDRLRRVPDDPEWLGVVEYRFRHRDGQYHWFSDHVHLAYDATGSPRVLSGSVRDVSQTARLEESLHILEKKFQDGQKMAGLGLLASGIAHDFNNLMTVVLGNTELALIEKGGSDGGVLDEIKKTTLRAAELANQMLVYTGKTTLKSSRMNLSLVVKEMASLLDVSISKKVKIEYCLDEQVPPIHGDVSQIRQVAMNLITNASEAIGDRPGVIAISIHETRLKTGQLEKAFPAAGIPAGDYVQLEVSDTGSGMDRATLEKIFDPLFTTKVTGRGLGLAALLNAVERHNGAVTVESEPGQGTVFRVYFPVAPPDPNETGGTVAPEDAGWRGWGTALIADDEEAIRHISSALLEQCGFRVVTAADGLETVNRFTRHAEEISLLLIDLKMPRLNGIEAVLRIRHINPNLPVLFMSGYPRNDVMERFGDEGHTGFIHKPFQNRDLIAAVRAVMEARHR